jgi:acetyl-CoA carboxylase biotin carboxyl carrier protein
MIDLEFIERLVRVLDESGLDSLDIERGGTRIRLSKTPQASAPLAGGVASGVAPGQPPQAHRPADAPATAAGAAAPAERKPAAAASDLIEVTAPMVGTFYLAPAPDAPPYVDTGSRVKPGDTLCIIEAMKLMNELECEVSGTIAEVCVENAQPVEFGQVLFRVDPA